MLNVKVILTHPVNQNISRNPRFLCVLCALCGLNYGF